MENMLKVDLELSTSPSLPLALALSLRQQWLVYNLDQCTATLLPLSHPGCNLAELRGGATLQVSGGREMGGYKGSQGGSGGPVAVVWS